MKRTAPSAREIRTAGDRGWRAGGPFWSNPIRQTTTRSFSRIFVEFSSASAGTQPWQTSSATIEMFAKAFKIFMEGGMDQEYSRRAASYRAPGSRLPRNSPATLSALRTVRITPGAQPSAAASPAGTKCESQGCTNARYAATVEMHINAM